MSYIDEVYQRVVEQNPSQPEFHQAVKEVLMTLKPAIDAQRGTLPQGSAAGKTGGAGSSDHVPGTLGG